MSQMVCSIHLIKSLYSCQACDQYVCDQCLIFGEHKGHEASHRMFMDTSIRQSVIEDLIHGCLEMLEGYEGGDVGEAANDNDMGTAGKVTAAGEVNTIKEISTAPQISVSLPNWMIGRLLAKPEYVNFTRIIEDKHHVEIQVNIEPGWLHFIQHLHYTRTFDKIASSILFSIIVKEYICIKPPIIVLGLLICSYPYLIYCIRMQ